MNLIDRIRPAYSAWSSTLSKTKTVCIAIAGNIGSGKITFTNMLVKHYGWTSKLGSVDVNPYSDDYYRSIERWTFDLEVYSLKQRFHDLLDIAQSKEITVQDRSIYEGVHVFAANNRDMGYLPDRDFSTYMELFEVMVVAVKLLDLMIYLRSSVPNLVGHIQRRGRSYGQTVPLEYLTNLNERYEDSVLNKHRGKKSIIEANALDSEHNPKDFSEIIDKIGAQLFGLLNNLQSQRSAFSTYQQSFYPHSKHSFIMHIAIVGSIGGGRTTLTTMLAKRYNWIPQFGPVDDNPYLNDFYVDMIQWSSDLQIYFFNKRFRDVVAISKSHDAIIQGRTIFKDAYIFVPNPHNMGMMSDRDFDNYTDLFSFMMSLAKLPDLLIHIRSGIPNLVSHIQRRGRKFEKSTRIDYLQGLNTLYENWISTYKGNLMIVDGDCPHFKENPQDFKEIADMTGDRLHGSFPLDAK